jgi:transglutaminase-like putative cysteine protease
MLNQSALTLANITWLLAAMGFVIAPHVMRLPVWVSAVCVAAGAWRWWIARHALRTPPWWLMAMIAIAVAVGARVEYGRWFGREIGVTLLIVMLCLKVLEMRMKRDAMLAIFLGFFLALTNFLYSQSIMMGVYVVGCAWVFVATLIGFNRINTEATARERLLPAGWLVLQAIPMMLVLFFLFPRLSGPLWSMPGDEQSRSGLTDEMTPGDISKLSLSEAIAFRVDFDGAVPNNDDLYWRGPVLGEQVGRSWRAFPPDARYRPEYVPAGASVTYRVTLFPSNRFWLFALDLPVAAPDNAFISEDFQMRSRTPVTALRSYTMASHLRYTTGVELSARDRERYTRTSRGINPRTVIYAQKLREDNPDPKVLIEKLMARYNSEFEYTLEPPPLGPNPVDEFLFDTKKGFCEHYASSFVFILRAAGIPARVVTGYQGGEVNPISRQLVVRQSEAHAWAEVWFEGLGWVRADPTFAVSPLRINRGMTQALGPQGAFNIMMEADKLGILRQLSYSWDAVNNQWNQWVVGFGQDRQRYAMETFFGAKDIDWRQLAIWLIVGVFSTGGAAGLLVLMRAYRHRKDPVVAAYDRFCAKLAKAGVARAPHEGPADLQVRIEHEKPAIAPSTREVLDAYVALRYAQPDASSRRNHFSHFTALVRQFRGA